MTEDNDEGGFNCPPKGRKVGYCNPPEEYQYKKGDPSPNPDGRRGKPKSDSSFGEKGFLDKKIWISDNGKRIHITRDEYSNRKLFALLHEGNVQASKRLDERCAAIARRSAEQRATVNAVTDDDAARQKVIENALERRAKKAARASKTSDTNKEPADE
jgi:hypothetical protein